MGTTSRGTLPGVGSAGGCNPGGSRHDVATTRRDAAPRDFNSILGTTTAAASPRVGAPSGDAKMRAYGDLTRNIDELVERDHEGSGGSASSLAKDPRKTNLLQES